MGQIKTFGGKEYKLIKSTPYKGEANETKKTYKHGGFQVRMEKIGRVYYVWARR